MRGLFDAIGRGDREGVRALLSASPDLASARNDEGVSAVLWACYAHAAMLARDLADAKGELDIFEAAALDRHELVGRLIQGDGGLVSSVSPDGYTPLHLAAYLGAQKAALVLLEAGADVHAVAANPARTTPLHAATEGRQADLVQMLLEAGADVDARQEHGWTPLHAAAQSGDAAILETLLGGGADPQVRNDEGITPAELADLAGHSTLAALLKD
ncbi:MAG: ankyrin repeat domain-containing protein [Carbonactinosporaceae bacterium]